ncbi:hypothetical protein HPB52_000492 [Rhipicephalus sanguineus]|uniref:Uncharacterized protein n=1 Tax=Rhipicephalus sanguineus TaxID=34632 RepID=A0A9D4PBR2_RHISA|nr:hypothetical protein HPB52_000492 [Rhipicephalus sanguineus]
MSHREGGLTATELQEAENIWFRQAQTETYAKERAQLEVGQDLDKTSSIRDLNPFIDEKGVMRITTRLQNADVTYNEMTLVLLPCNHASATSSEARATKVRDLCAVPNQGCECTGSPTSRQREIACLP